MLDNKNQNKNVNLNIEEIMQVNDILKPYQEKSNEVLEENIKDKCDFLEVEKKLKFKKFRKIL